MKHPYALLVLPLLLGHTGCMPRDTSNAARAEILRLDAAWSEAAEEGRDVDRIVSFWSDDATVFPPGSPPIVGKPALREFVTKSLKTPEFHISWKTTDVVVSSGSDMAYATGTNRVSFNDADGKEVVLNGKAMTVWRRDKAGAWKCAIDIWNDVPATAPIAAPASP